jgi:hypothetical protein
VVKETGRPGEPGEVVLTLVSEVVWVGDVPGVVKVVTAELVAAEVDEPEEIEMDVELVVVVTVPATNFIPKVLSPGPRLTEIKA